MSVQKLFSSNDPHTTIRGAYDLDYILILEVSSQPSQQVPEIFIAVSLQKYTFLLYAGKMQ